MKVYRVALTLNDPQLENVLIMHPFCQWKHFIDHFQLVGEHGTMMSVKTLVCKGRLCCTVIACKTIPSQKGE